MRQYLMIDSNVMRVMDLSSYHSTRQMTANLTGVATPNRSAPRPSVHSVLYFEVILFERSEACLSVNVQKE